MLTWLKRAFRSRYVVLLEEEVARLRMENRAMMNSLLGTAGFPPMDMGDLTDQQLAQTNALNQQLLGQQQSLGNQLLPQYQSILNNPGYSAADKAAITGQSQGALASAFDALQQSAMNRMARTGNSAGFSELTDELARQKGQQEANLAQQNEMNFSNTALQRQMAALQGLSGLYGVDTNLLGRTLGIPSELLNVRSNAARSGFFSSLGSSLGGIPALFL